MVVKDLRDRCEMETNSRMVEEDRVLKLTQEGHGLKNTVNRLEGEKQDLEE